MYRFNVTIVAFVLMVLSPATGNCKMPDTSDDFVKTISVKLPQGASLVMKNIANVFKHRIEERSSATVNIGSHGDLKVQLVIKKGIGTEGFRIVKTKNKGIVITGNDERGVLYGVGKFLRTSVYSKDGFKPGTWFGTTVPDKKVRGMYLATHFYNYYQNAPVSEVQRYIEDIALWGVNSLLVWYDMHHFNGFEDTAAVAYRDRLGVFLETAQKLGVSVGFTLVGNEGYANSPVNLRAPVGKARGGYYITDICPNKPEGIDYIIREKSVFFDWCNNRGIHPEYICIWPYDQGGCATEDCQPWGSNGFIKCAKAISTLARNKFKDVKIITSTWFFDSMEWDALSKLIAADGSWTDFLLSEGDAPGKEIAGLPVVGFPEISMHNTFPWGGFGATPLPHYLSRQWQNVSGRLAGGFPYSEGIYEDISKVVYTQLYWNASFSIEQILKEYISYEYSPEVVDGILKVINTLEQNHHMRWWPGKLEGVKLTLNWFPSRNAPLQPDPGAEEAYIIVKKVDQDLPQWARVSWRWRILYIRTMLDAELKANGGSPNERCIEGFKELMKIYHTTEKSDPAVRPPIQVQ